MDGDCSVRYLYCGKKPGNHCSTSVWLFFMDPDRVIRFEQSWNVSSAKLNDVSLYQQAIPSQIRTCQIWKWNSIVVKIYTNVFLHLLYLYWQKASISWLAQLRLSPFLIQYLQKYYRIKNTSKCKISTITIETS